MARGLPEENLQALFVVSIVNYCSNAAEVAQMATPSFSIIWHNILYCTKKYYTIL